MRLNENGTVRVSGIKPEMIVGVMLMQAIFDKYSVARVWTAGTEEFDKNGEQIHMTGSRHPLGYAVDVRSREIPDGVWTKFLSDLKDILGCEFDVVVHSSHIHVEFNA